MASFTARVVAIEGLDGAGKTSLQRSLIDRAEAVGAVGWRGLPEFSSPFGPVLKATLGTVPSFATMYAFAAERHWLIQELAPWDEGVILIDRYRHSAFACRGADVQLGRAVGEILDAVQEVYAHLPTPDLTLYVRRSIPSCLERLRIRDGLANEAVQTRHAHLEFQQAYFERFHSTETEPWIVVDPTFNSASLFELVRRALDHPLRALATPI